MSETTTDWTAMALNAMDQQKQEEQAAEVVIAEQTEAPSAMSKLGPGIAKLSFLGVLGYVLVTRYGVFHLLWLAAIAYQIISTMTFPKKTAYK